MVAPVLSFVLLTGGPFWSLVVPQPSPGSGCEVDRMCVGVVPGPWSCSSCPDHPTHVTLQGGLSLSLSLSLSAVVITVSTLIMTFSDITDNILLISVTARQAQFKVADV